MTIERSKSRRDVYFDTWDVGKGVGNPCDEGATAEGNSLSPISPFDSSVSKEWRNKNCCWMWRAGI
jgi:hypothetical protein